MTDLERWRGSVVTWAEENCYVRHPETGKFGPLQLFDHQRHFLEEATRRDADGALVHRVAVCSYPKREGKSLLAAIIGAWRLACFEGQRVGVLANSERQAASNIFDHLCQIYRHSPALAEYVTADSFKTRTLTIVGLDNRAECYPCNADTIQGVFFSLLLSDELHAAENPKAFTFASQQTEGPDSQVVISSQAGAPVNSNPLWRLYRAAEPHIFFDYRTEVSTPWSKKLAEQAKDELLPGEYDYLWGNAWGATGLKLLSPRDIEQACWDYAMPRTEKQWQQLKKAWGWERCVIGVGLDRAGVSRSGDRTVWTVTANAEDEFRVVYQKVLPTGSEAEILATDEWTRAIFGKPDKQLFEYYNCSDVVDKVKGAELGNATSQEQQKLFNRMARIVREWRFAFPEECDLLKQELIAFEYDAEREGATKFGTQKGHDDCAYSLAWSLEASDISRPKKQARSYQG